jgi:hypothetical protein
LLLWCDLQKSLPGDLGIGGEEEPHRKANKAERAGGGLIVWPEATLSGIVGPKGTPSSNGLPSGHSHTSCRAAKNAKRDAATMSGPEELAVKKGVQEAFEALRAERDDKLSVLTRLFADLNYKAVLQPLATSGWPTRAREVVSSRGRASPCLLATAGRGGEFRVIYVPLKPGQRRSAPLLLTSERIVAQHLLRETMFPDSLLVFSDPDQRHWHFVNPRLVSRGRYDGGDGPRVRHVLRRIAVGPDDKLRTAVERFSRIRLTHDEADTLSPLRIHDRHDEAFNVESVTDEFFREFKERFLKLEERLVRETHDQPWAHDYALRLLSRIMFVYFIQRKRWLGEDPHFMARFWQAYCDAPRCTRGAFFREWLEPLFFEAFASPAEASLVAKRDYMPADIMRALRNAPYLNGGLFSRDELDTKHASRVTIPDEFFEGLLDPKEGFFERYNFTIAEDTPLDQEVAVDPEMIGQVYESLVNISEPGSEAAQDRQRQREAGIFYTPRTEIDLMCRLALSDYLCNHLGHEHRGLVYQIVFALEPQEKEAADAEAARHDLWPRLDELIRGVTVVDPACGSGSFLVGMMNILFDLRQRAAAQLGSTQTENEMKREIVRQNLYGVDVMPWAVEVAELRLWLQLVVHTELDPAELIGPRPLLPNLSFKIRQGDSLVEEIAGVNLVHLKGDVDIPKELRGRLRQLQARKLQFYEATGPRSPETEAAIRQEERKLFLDVLSHKAVALQQKIQRVDARLREQRPQIDGTLEPAASPEERRSLQEQREQLQAQLDSVTRAHAAVTKAKQVPFIWDLAFVEIFQGDKQGFDIVIGNPPYVRQERISEPSRPFEEQSREERNCYKAALARSVYAAYPRYFGPDPDRPRFRLDGRSDLCLYFYFHALSLLNSRGAFCFISSNSWLDTDYGAELQEFLARQVPIHMILDNRVKRSFAQALINTVIVLLGPPAEERDAALDHTARFVMVEVPFEAIVDPVIFMEIDEARQKTTRPEFRVWPISQRELLERGMVEEEGKAKRRPSARGKGKDSPSAERKTSAGEVRVVRVKRYEGDKWGGKYLRAPDIYYEILEAAGDKLVPLGEIAEVRRGFTTGANEFFYVRPAGERLATSGEVAVVTGKGTTHVLPAEILRPAIVSPRSITRPQLTKDMSDRLLVCIPPVSPRSLPASVREYIRWGESQGYHQRRTVSGRRFWYVIEPREPGPILLIMTRRRRHVIGWNVARLQVDHNLFEVTPRATKDAPVVAAALATSFSILQAEILGRTSTLGALKTEGVDIVRFMVLSPSATPGGAGLGLTEAFRALAQQKIVAVYDQLTRAEHRALDDEFLRALGIAEAKRRERMAEELRYWAARLVWDRVAKGEGSRESRQTYDEWLASGKPFDASARGEEADEELEEDADEDL